MSIGDIWFDSGTSSVKFWDGKQWIMVMGELLSIKEDIFNVRDEISNNTNATERALNVLRDNIAALEKYRDESTKWLSFDSTNGLTIGAKENAFRTVIDNQSMRFLDGSSIVAYISNQQLGIKNAIIEETLYLGNFLFSPHSSNDKGFSITWEEL